MLAFIKGIGLKFWAGFVAFLLIVAAFAKTFSAGHKSAQVDGLKGQLDNVKVRNDVENEVRRAGPDAVHDELRDKWTRD